MNPPALFADVLLPLPVPGRFTYRIPEELTGSVEQGMRVVVQFGAKKLYTGLVTRLHDHPPPGVLPKPVLSLLDETPIVHGVQLAFWEWMASYYLCYPGEVMGASLPSAFRLASESKIAPAEYPPEILPPLSPKEELLMEALHHRKSIAVSEISRILDQQKTIPVIKTLMEKGLIVPEEELHDPYRPRREYFVQLTPGYAENEVALKEVFDTLEKRAPKQLALLMAWIRLSGFGFREPADVPRRDLLDQAKAASAQLDALTGKGIFRVVSKVVSRFDAADGQVPAESILLTPAQQKAFDEIRDQFAAKEVCLLHGVTSSGKTEIYIKLIQETLDAGKQALFLLPEIALTTQTIQRLQKYFGDRVGVYHSRFNLHERVEVWRSVMQNDPADLSSGRKFDIILGARSAIFLPFTNLGLVVVDEEHDPSFKQSDPAPRYHGRDAALYLARMHGAKTLLGTATPSVESYFNARQGKYGLVELTERYGSMELPVTEVIDLREALRKGHMKSHFSVAVLDEIASSLREKRQVILFQNRRGFSLRLQCDICHWMPQCLNCDVTLVYHKKANQLRCHYCGYTSGIPATCPDCKSNHLKMKGFGTEKIEEELGLIFPEARIARMDLDTTRTRQSLQQIITAFEEGRVDILVGTQMVTKGLDFDHVGMVCILNADNMLSYPDFRSAERSFQLMEQVSGRSGRKHRRGKVMIQTFHPNHPVIRQVMDHDYLSLYRRQAEERHRFGYPPFVRLVMLRVKHRDQETVNRAADALAARLRQSFGKRVLGPEYPLVARIMNQYIKTILVKLDRGPESAVQKGKLAEITEAFGQGPWRQVRILTDVDPQ